MGHRIPDDTIRIALFVNEKLSGVILNLLNPFPETQQGGEVALILSHFCIFSQRDNGQRIAPEFDSVVFNDTQ